MHPALYNRFEQLFREYPPSGNEILEIGATANVSETLLSVFKHISRTYHCVGINIKANSTDNLPYTLIQCNGNDMNIFEDESFDAVVCNAVLEHDKFFWKTIAEVKRLMTLLEHEYDVAVEEKNTGRAVGISLMKAGVKSTTADLNIVI